MYDFSDMTTVQCQFCANPLELEISSDMITCLGSELSHKLARMTVHNGCAEQMEAKQRRVTEDIRLAKALQEWEMLCPPFYQSTEEWLKTAESKTLNRAAIAKALAWVFGPRGLVLFGAHSGTGKTSAAYLILKREVTRGKACAVYSHTEFSLRMIQLYDDTKRSARWIRLLGTCDILLIDDFGKSRFKTADGRSNQAEEMLFDILDGRITSQLPTILTSNDDAATLKERMSEQCAEPLLRRLREFFIPVNFDVNKTKA